MGSRDQGFLRGIFDFLVAPIPVAAPKDEPRLMRIVLAGVAVDYHLHRARRKTVSMAIAREGLIVRAPMRLAQREIDAVLTERGLWIVQTMREWRERTSLVAAAYHDGGSILFRGKRMKLRVVPALFESFEVGESEILIASPTVLPPAAQKAAIETWMRAVAQEEFAPQIAAMAQALEVDVKTIKLTDTKTMWGSCTSSGVVRLTFRLIQLPPKLAHYVMAHEVAHLREMNHSPKFWAWVRVLDPHYKSNRRTLGAYTPLLEE
jgi:predicted metal-dependent hydrolase